jgi:hypothetical protein
MDILLARLDAPNEFGLFNRSKKWQFMLMLSDLDDSLPAPELTADDETIMSWLSALFETHFETARTALLSRP